jgi:hypothetical protein
VNLPYLAREVGLQGRAGALYVHTTRHDAVSQLHRFLK